MVNQSSICPCCRLNSVSVRRVCSGCELHQGNTGIKIQQRDRDHVTAWKREQAKWGAQAQRATQRLEDELEKMRIELEARPIHVVHENLDAETVAEAESSRDAAYRSRDMTMQILCQVRLLHQERIQGECTCGKSRSKCKTADIVTEFEALDKWETKQIKRMRQNLDHLLPDNHPAVLDRRRSW
jgi:hypothetical protein